jgi:hypothetical protein
VHQSKQASRAERVGAVDYKPFFQTWMPLTQTREKITDDAIRERPRNVLD